ncbi:MAG: hypothetical protein D3904_01975 [Candidatus Electrothrix sp. EH2]|nr:hypothetical protein [Candidatus Electrothrix sp. EH2]
MLAILPPCLISHKIKEIQASERVDSAAISLEVEGDRETFVPLQDPAAKKTLVKLAENKRKIKHLRRLAAFCTTVMVLTALTAIGMAVYSWDQEHGREICIGSIMNTVVALSWQYIGAGVSVGVAVLVFIVLVAGLT